MLEIFLRSSFIFSEVIFWNFSPAKKGVRKKNDLKNGKLKNIMESLLNVKFVKY